MFTPTQFMGKKVIATLHFENHSKNLHGTKILLVLPNAK